MAGELKLNNVSVATESGGVVSLSAANTVAFPAGHVINFKTTTYGSEISGITADTWVTTNLSIQITPKYTNSKIVVISTFGFTANNPDHVGFKVQRTGPSTQDLGIQSNYSNNNGFFVPQMSSYSAVDSPNTNSALCTYTLYYYVVNNTAGSFWNYDGKYSSIATMFLMEIKE